MTTTSNDEGRDDDFKVIVISGPGGVGKGTIVNEILKRDPRLWLSRSWTTRDPRPGESPDNYHFKTADEFQRHIDSGGFLEWANFLDYMQGSPIPDPPAGMDVVRRVETATVTIDAYCARNAIDHIAVMKMDIQGAEILALEGAAGRRLASSTSRSTSRRSTRIRRRCVGSSSTSARSGTRCSGSTICITAVTDSSPGATRCSSRPRSTARASSPRMATCLRAKR